MKICVLSFFCPDSGDLLANLVCEIGRRLSYNEEILFYPFMIL